MNKSRIVLSILYLLFLYSCQNKADKITLSQEVQDYFFATQETLLTFVLIQDECFTPLKDTLDYRDYKLISYHLLLLSEELTSNREQLLKTKRKNLPDKEKLLIKHMNQYVDKLSESISLLSSIFSRLDVISSYPPNEYSADIDRFYLLRDDYIRKGKTLNTLLEDFYITPPPK